MNNDGVIFFNDLVTKDDHARVGKLGWFLQKEKLKSLRKKEYILLREFKMISFMAHIKGLSKKS